jgi:hypothetical protein
VGVLGLLVAKSEETGSVPSGSRDGEGDLREARIGSAVPGEALSQNRNPMHLPVPFPGQDGSGPDFYGQPVLVDCLFASIFWGRSLIEKALALIAQITEMVGLKPIGEHAEQQVSWM